MDARPSPDEGLEAEVARLREHVAELERDGAASTVNDSLSLEQVELFRMLFELAPVGIAVVSPEGRWLTVNDRLCAMLGYRREELAELTWAELTPPDELEREREPYAAFLAGTNRRNRLEKRYLRKDGQLLEVEVTVNLIRNPDGSPQVLLAMVQDITERKAAEERLARSEERYRLLAETAHELIVVHDMEGRVVYANPAALRITGYTEGEALGISVAEVIAPEWRDAEAERMRRRRAREGGVSRFETEVIARDGHRVPMEISATAIVSDDRVEQVLAIGRDISDRREAEAALRESEQRFREMLEAVQLAAVMLDLDGRITFCNEHLAKLTGWTREELEGRDWFDTLLPETARADARATYFERTSQGSLQAHFERPLMTRSGEIRQLAWDATLIRDPQGRVVGVARLGRDVTELRRLEEQYRQAQKMEAVGQLAGGVAHDFNNILQVILGYVDLAQHGLTRGREPYPELDQIAQAASRATALVRQLLTFSRRQPLRPQRLDLDQVITGMTKMLQRILGENIELLFGGPGGLPAVWGDPGHVEQVLVNLCVNARDAMPRGGSIRVTTGAADLDPSVALRFPWARPGRFVALTVADTGTGMTPEVMEHLFEPFFTTKEVGKGTGLGLATVYGIVRQHGGVIEASSNPGQGSTFSVYLPVAAEDEPQVEVRQGESVPAAVHGETVLVAEDDDQVRSLAAEILERAGYRVLVARDGNEALALFGREGDRVDLFVLDALMPHASGEEVWNVIRAQRPDARVLFCTGYSASSLGSASPAGGDVSVLQKPFTSAELLARVRELLHV